MRKSLSLILVAAYLFIGAIPSLANQKTAKDLPKNADTYQLIILFNEVFNKARQDYVEEVSDQKLVESAINGMLSALDPHSGYMTEESFKEMQIQTKGEFGGVGLEVGMENGVVVVISPIEDTPGHKAGLQPGDLITHIDDKAVHGLTLTEAVNRMRGEPKSKVKLNVHRKGVAAPLTFNIVREVIKVRVVRSSVKSDNIGYVRITSFSESTETMAKKAVNDIKAKTKNKVAGYIIDLRNNPGGLLDQAIGVADLFLDKGEIVSTRPRDETKSERYNATSGDITSGKPLVVLVNDGSASASEIVAGALQDHKRAVVVGTKSFGKGSVQSVYPIQGYGGIRLTTARYYTPSGRSIQAKGIEPDIIIKQATLKEMENSGGFNEGNFVNALGSGQKDEQNASPAKSVEADDEDKNDYQLNRAKDILRAIAVYSAEGQSKPKGK